MQYIAALDYEHLDNGVFLTTLARSLSRQQEKKNLNPVIIHADSAYTERIMQTGVMREEATIRSIKDLNNRLVALFADQGVSTIGINPYHRKFITIANGSMELDHTFLDSLPRQSVLLLSSLVYDVEKGRAAVVDLPRFMSYLHKELKADQLFIFSKSDKSEVFTDLKPDQKKTVDDKFRDEQIPNEFSDLNYPVRLTTARDFNQIPNLEQALLINPKAS